MNPSYLADLQKGIRQIHGCEGTHIETVPVKEMVEGETVWEGDVEVFDLAGHKRAKRLYAWGYLNEKGGMEVATVLEISPVESAVTAVRTAMAAQIKKLASQDPFWMMLEMGSYFPPEVAALFAQPSKKDVEKVLGEFELTRELLARAIMGARQGGYRHERHHFEYVPEDLKRKSSSLRDLLHEKKIAEVCGIVSGIFQQRKLISAHLFEKPGEWHILYCDQRDIAEGKDAHWKGGAHWHYISHLFGNRLTKDDVWNALKTGIERPFGGVHIKYKHDTPETETVPDEE